MDDTICWENSKTMPISQGEYLKECPVVIVSDILELTDELEAKIEIRNLLVMTQSCDLAQNKAKSVALCPIYTLGELAESNIYYSNKKNWENVRQGRVEGWHMVPGFLGFNNQEALVVDFRQIYSLPISFLNKFVDGSNLRKRLKSPYLEHTAQSFARFFMRVGLPSNIEQFK